MYFAFELQLFVAAFFYTPSFYYLGYYKTKKTKWTKCRDTHRPRPTYTKQIHNITSYKTR
jgi:hypothetical protein